MKKDIKHFIRIPSKTKGKECKHSWHFIREFYFDEWESLTSLRKLRGNYAKFVCDECGKIKFIREFEDDNQN